MPPNEPVIEGMSAVTVHVLDIQRARKFYIEVLGLTEVTHQPDRRRSVFKIPALEGTVLSMHEMAPEEQGRPAGTVSGIIFSHRDPAWAMEEIRRRGGTVVAEVARTPFGFLRGVFADPDGNEFLLAGSS
jgi:predicted enzyme related to lactoylglutathione lyase